MSTQSIQKENIQSWFAEPMLLLIHIFPTEWDPNKQHLCHYKDSLRFAKLHMMGWRIYYQTLLSLVTVQQSLLVFTPGIISSPINICSHNKWFQCIQRKDEASDNYIQSVIGTQGIRPGTIIYNKRFLHIYVTLAQWSAIQKQDDHIAYCMLSI